MNQPLNFKFIEDIVNQVMVDMIRRDINPVSIEIGKYEWASIMRSCPSISVQSPEILGLPLVIVDDKKYLKVCDDIQTALRKKHDECLSKIRELDQAIIEQSKGLVGQEVRNKILTNPIREQLIKEATNCSSRMTPPIHYS